MKWVCGVQVLQVTVKQPHPQEAQPHWDCLASVAPLCSSWQRAKFTDLEPSRNGYPAGPGPS
jgi:hypothetical protein